MEVSFSAGCSFVIILLRYVLMGVICLLLELLGSATIGVLMRTLLGVELFMSDLSAVEAGDGDDLNKQRRVWNVNELFEQFEMFKLMDFLAQLSLISVSFLLGSSLSESDELNLNKSSSSSSSSS